LPIVSLLLQNNSGIVFAGGGVLLLLRFHAVDSVGRFISCVVF